MLKIGVATYTLRLWKIDETIALLQKLGLEYCSLKDAHLPRNATPEELRAIVQKFQAAGITPLSCGNIGLKNDEADVRSALTYAKNAGIGVVVCAPPVDALPLLDQLVKEYDVRLAIHNHGPEDKHFPTPYDAYERIKKLDKRIGLCVDVGHCARGGKDPARAILDCRDRVYDVHLKDIHTTERNGRAKEVGRGVLDIPSILRALQKIRFEGNVGFEYEKDEKDPSLGLAESAGFVRGVLRGR
jgi:inosose dehydratase